MAAVTGNGINPAVNLVPAQVIPTMGHSSIVLRLILNGGLQFRFQHMAVITKTVLVAHVTDWTVCSRHLTVIFGEIDRMVVTFIDNGFGLGLVTFRAHLVSGHLFGMLGRNGISWGHGGTGKKKDHTAAEKNMKSVDFAHGSLLSVREKSSSSAHLV